MREFIPKMLVFFRQKKRGLTNLFGLFLAYGVLKSIVYLAPLLLNNVLKDVQRFGEFEYSLNLGQTFATIFALGLPNAYAYFVFKEKNNHLNVIFHNIYLAIALIVLLLGLIYPPLFSDLYFNAVLIGIALSNQLYITTYYKLKGKNIVAVVIDCGIYILLLLFVYFLFKRIIEFKISIWSYIILGYIILMNLRFHIGGAGKFSAVTKADWGRVLKYGILIVLTLFFTSILTTSTRVFIEYFDGFHSVGLYSLCIRIASAIIIFHRVVVILLYRKIYMDAHALLDRYFQIIILIACLGGAILYFLVPILAPRFIPSFAAAGLGGSSLFIWSVLQALTWTTVAVLELIIYRENLLAGYIRILMLLSLLLAGSIFIYSKFLPISAIQILKINVLAVMAIPYGQIWLLRKKTFFYKKTLTAHLILSVCCVIALIL